MLNLLEIQLKGCCLVICYLLDLRSDMSSLSFDMVASQDLGGFA